MKTFVELIGKFHYKIPNLIVGESVITFDKEKSYRTRYLAARGFKFQKDIVVSIKLHENYIQINREHFDYTRGQMAKPQMRIDPWDFTVNPGDIFILDLEDSTEDVLFFLIK